MGERQTEDLKVACSIHAHRIFSDHGYCGFAHLCTTRTITFILPFFIFANSVFLSSATICCFLFVLDCLSPEVKQNEIGHLEKQPLGSASPWPRPQREPPEPTQFTMAQRAPAMRSVRCTRRAKPFRHFPSNGQPIYNRLNAHYHYSADR